MEQLTFEGFPEDIIAFFEDLSMNNNRQWFIDNKSRYERSVLNPSRDFVAAMGDRLREIAPDIVAIPQVNGSLFRLNRDTRFSPDKTPYKTHMGIIMWQGSRKRMENPGYFFHIEPGKYMVGAGLYMFLPEIMYIYRKAVIDDRLGPELEEAIRKVETNGFSVGEKKYKKVPKDFPKDHERAELLKYGGLFALEEGPLQKWIFDEDILDELLQRFDGMRPIQEWMLKVLGQW